MAKRSVKKITIFLGEGGNDDIKLLNGQKG